MKYVRLYLSPDKYKNRSKFFIAGEGERLGNRIQMVRFFPPAFVVKNHLWKTGKNVLYADYKLNNGSTPVNRIPIMAKQVLDLYELYRLVVARGGLVEVINKKIWREITKGLNLPSSITSAAFTLRTQGGGGIHELKSRCFHLNRDNLDSVSDVRRVLSNLSKEFSDTLE
ncbi:protein dead ringer homolog [Trichonephila clavipes]|nr:protein dead ringer homolog [Trichonephila clavipes]